MTGRGPWACVYAITLVCHLAQNAQPGNRHVLPLGHARCPTWSWSICTGDSCYLSIDCLMISSWHFYSFITSKWLESRQWGRLGARTSFGRLMNHVWRISSKKSPTGPNTAVPPRPVPGVVVPATG